MKKPVIQCQETSDSVCWDCEETLRDAASSSWRRRFGDNNPTVELLMFARFAEWKMDAIKKLKGNFFDAALEASLPTHKIHKSTDQMFNDLKNGEVLYSSIFPKT